MQTNDIHTKLDRYPHSFTKVLPETVYLMSTRVMCCKEITQKHDNNDNNNKIYLKKKCKNFS